MCTDASRSPGSMRHSSSIVTDRIGASSRARPSTMMNIAVWPERRASDLAPKVYIRSLVTSM